MEVVKILNQFYDTNVFERVPSSGARATTSKNLTEEKATILVGDIIVPKDFPVFIETKFYRNEPDIWRVFETGRFPPVWEEERQKQMDQIRVTDKKGIILVFRANNRKWMTMMELSVFYSLTPIRPTPDKFIMIKISDKESRIIISFDEFLTLIPYGLEKQEIV